MQGPVQKQFEIKSQFLRSFFEFLTTYETQKNDAFFSVLFLRTEKNAMFFCKERKRTQRTFWMGGKGGRGGWACCALESSNVIGIPEKNCFIMDIMIFMVKWQ